MKKTIFCTMALLVALMTGCSGGGGTSAIDTIDEGLGPVWNFSDPENTSALVGQIIAAVKASLYEPLPDTNAENEAIKNQLCTTKHVNQSIVTSPETGGSEGIAINGVIQEDWVGNDGLDGSVNLSGQFDAVGMNYSEAVFTITGSGSYSVTGSSPSGASSYCESTGATSSLASSTAITESVEGTFVLSGGIGGKLAYNFSASQAGGGAFSGSGSATLVSGGQSTACTITASGFGKDPQVVCE